MKIRQLLSAAVIITVTAVATAQTSSQPETRRFINDRYGIAVGAGMNSIATSNLSQKLQLNVSAGAYTSWTVSSAVIETGLWWNRRDYNLTGFIPQYSDMTRLKTHLNFIEIPLKLGWEIYLSDFKKQSVSLTPSIGMYGACAVDDSMNGFRRFDIGGTLGLQLNVNRWSYRFDYRHGWRDINTRIDRHIKTRSFDFSIGYAFIIK